MRRSNLAWGTATAVLLVGSGIRAAEQPTVDQALAMKPLHADIEYDIPDAKSAKQCKILPVKVQTKVKVGKEEKEQEKIVGWELQGPAGQVLRRFLDLDSDGWVDQLSYYRGGLEVYRDIDSDFNHKPDQSRWLNLGGTRWGVDKNEDGKIDQWKVISAEEVSRVAVRALVSQDASLLAPLLVTKQDLEKLGIKGALETKLLESVSDPAGKLRKAVSGSKIIHAKTTWLRFDVPSPPGVPSVVPADMYKTPGDLHVYENVMAIVDSGNPQQPGLVKIGELVRIDDVWKMTELPAPLEGSQFDVTPGIIMFQGQGAAADPTLVAGAPALSDKVQELIEKQLKPLLENPPAASSNKAVFDKYFKQVENKLIAIIGEMKTDEEYNQWTRQLLDTIAAAVQSGNYPAGLDRLKQLEATIAKDSPKSPLLALARYRKLVAQYSLSMRDAESSEARQKIHDQWPKQLEDFLDEFPKADDAPDAAMQLAIALEFAGKTDPAKKWYEKVAADYGESSIAPRAAGALKRIDLVGKSLALAGASISGGAIDVKQLRGKTLLVVFWDTRSKPCIEDVPLLKGLYDQYKAKGFEIVGVNLDLAKEDVAPFLTSQQIKWPQIYDGGGLESAAARAYGIISLPTMFLTDAEGRVVNRSATIDDVKRHLKETYDAK